ncbi:hypothetical protein F5Y04DRAFT_263945 [Hypomontagnella monticulosa]|nr:hypothetical protein F5Y04DRAFT_263945 [Hypomontagnella monticulosa]
MESKTSRYQSRILREMHQNNENPFNSPPSSTGSHGTITLTSNLSMGPQAESTRRMDDMSIKLPSQAAMRNAKAPQPTSLNINTSALGRTFPEWSRWNPNGPEREKDMWETASDAVPNPDGKENITPHGSPNSSVVATPRADESDRDKVESESVKSAHLSKDQHFAASRGALRSRAQMQPRVQTESECSLDLSEPLLQSKVAERGRHSHASTPNAAKNSKPRRGNVTALLETLKTAQSQQAESKEQSAKQASPKPQPAVQPQNAAKIHMERYQGVGTSASPATPNQTARSFFLPNLYYMNDFLSGALKLSSFRNGIPIFVKHGRVHDRESTAFPDYHAEVEAISIPEDEEKIFVSLDKIKDEIHALKEHDELVSRQAEQLQEEVEDLQIQIAKYKSRKDSAMGSDSESSIIDHLNAQKSQLEDQISSLQARLDKANRKISINEIHTESYVTERDEALKSATEHLEKIKHLQSELNVAHQQIELLQEDNTQNANELELENRSLRKDNNSIRQQWKSLLEENRSLRDHNSDVSQQNADLEHDLKTVKAQLDSNKGEYETLKQEYKLLLEEKAALKQDNLSLENHNDKFFKDNKILKEQNSSLDRQKHDLQDSVSQLEKLVGSTRGSKAGDKPMRYSNTKQRLELHVRELTKENADLQQQIVDIQLNFYTERSALEKEKERLAATNERLQKQMSQISEQFEQIMKESKEEAAMYEEQHVALTQQLELIADKESALAEKLKKTADREATLQSELTRRTDAINEARQITQEIKDFMSTVSKKKQAKATRIVDSKGKSTVSEATARSTTSQTDMQMQDDYTQQIDLTQGSEYASIFTQGEMPRLRDALRQVRSETQQRDFTGESWASDDDVSDQASQSLPPFLAESQPQAASSHRTVPGTSKGRDDSTKPRPVGILKDTQPSRLNSQKQKTVRTTTETGFEELRERDRTADSAANVRKSKSDDTIPRKVSFGQPGIHDEKASRSGPEPDFTGQFSVRSGMSIQSETSEADKFHRRGSDSVPFDTDVEHEDNMTSALFIDDITLEQQKMTEKQKAKKSTRTELSKDAKRVLDNLCHDHDCRNCIVCSRIKSRRHGSPMTPIRAEKPIPVTDLVESPYEYEPIPVECTPPRVRDPAGALAKTIKSLRDEEAHLIQSLTKKNAQYNARDASMHRDQWKRLGEEIAQLTRARDVKRDQIYYLYEVLEGQKATGLEMEAEWVEFTIFNAMSKDDDWDGVMDLN